MPTQTSGRPTRRAFSAKTMGKRPLPARRPIGCRCRSSDKETRRQGDKETEASPCLLVSLSPCLSTSLIVHPQLLLDAAHVLSQLRQLLQAHEDALLLALGRGRGAEDALAGGDVLGHAGLGAEDGTVADVDVVGDADLAGHDHVVAGGAGAGDAHLAD